MIKLPKSSFRICLADFELLEQQKRNVDISADEYDKRFSEARFNGFNGDIFPFAVGGSDAPIILGVSPYSTPLDLMLAKQKLRKEYYSSFQRKIFEIGHQYEEAIRNMFSYSTNLKTHPCFLEFGNKKYKNLIAHIDGLVEENGEIGLYEGKTTQFGTSTYNLFLQDIVPIIYFIQVQFYLEILDLNFAYINCAWGFDPESNFKHIRIERQPEIGEKICAICQDFVTKAEKGFLPNNKNVKDVVLQIKTHLKTYGTPSAKLPAKVLDPSLVTIFEQLYNCDKELEKINQQIDLLQAPIHKKESEIVKLKKSLKDDLKKIETKKKNKEIEKEKLFSTLYLNMKGENLGIIKDNSAKYVFKIEDNGFSFNAEVKEYFKTQYPQVYKDISGFKPNIPKFSYEIVKE